MAKATIGYKVIDMTTGRDLGIYQSVSERAAKAQAAKVTAIAFRYLTAVPLVSPNS